MKMLCNTKKYYFWNKTFSDQIKPMLNSYRRNFADIKPEMKIEAVNHDVEFHSKLADRWWDRSNPLHALNEIRVPYVRNNISHCGYLLGSHVNMQFPLEGVKILDVGCGGGILSEALARLHANVVGIDPSGPLIEVAKKHASLDQSLNGYLKYKVTSINRFYENNKNQFDAVVLSEVIEHVVNKEKVLEHSIHCLKPNGSLFITTPNRTWLSYLCTIQIAERLNILPFGTHDYKKFIRSEDLITLLKKLNCPVKRIEGIIYNPFTGKFKFYYLQVFMYTLFAQKAM